MDVNNLDSCVVETLTSEIIQCLKPGAHALIHSTPCSNHVIATRAENMGFEIRDVIAHLWEGETEFWILCRKPLEEKTVAENVLKWGCGGINIGKTRIGTETRTNQPAGSYLHTQKINDGRSAVVIDAYIEKQKSIAPTVTQGRWPANFILSHTHECVEIGTKKVKAIKSGVTQSTEPKGWKNTSQQVLQYGHGVDGTEIVESWECSPTCPVHLLDEQSGFLHGCGNKDIRTDRNPRPSALVFGTGLGGGAPSKIYDRGGGASRFFHTSKSRDDLLKYLTTLITPEQGTTHVFK